MNVEVIATGEELLDGRVVNSNLNDIARALLPYGFRVQRCVTVGDEPVHLLSAFQAAQARADLVIVTGGLGPTDDDRTSALLAELAGVPLVRDPAVLAMIEAFFVRLKRPMVEANKKQADLPKGAEALQNDKGTAPGIALEVDGCHFFALPGVPREMRHLIEVAVLPRMVALRGEAGAKPLLYSYKCFGAGESQFAERLGDLYPLEPGVDIGYRATFPEVHIRLSVSLGTEEANQARMDELKQAVSTRLSRFIYAEDDTTFTASLGKQLMEQGKVLAMAESCTGGLVGQMMTADAGSSAYFVASMVTYANQAKASILGVPMEVIEAHGAVSEPVARAMAEGALRVGQAGIAGAITGIAGPGGGSEDKPVGTVDIAVATEQHTLYRRFQFSGGRDRIRKLSAYAVLQMIRNELSGEDTWPTTLERKTPKGA